jgi:signal transduction histidine kinase
LGERIDLAFGVLGRAQRFAIIEVGTPIPPPTPGVLLDGLPKSAGRGLAGLGKRAVSVTPGGFPIPTAEPVSVNEAVTDAAGSSQTSADRRQVRLIPKLAPPDPAAPDAVVQGDSELLQIMVANLIRNAIRLS